MKILNLLIFLLFVGLIGCQPESEPIVISLDTLSNGFLIHEDPVYGLGPDLKLSSPLKKDLIIQLEVTGTASANFDYTVTNPVIIPKGETSASGNLVFLEDNLDEPDETLKIRIASVDDNSIEINNSSLRYIIEDDTDEADLRISLLWGSGGNTGSDQLDMDLYLWHELSPGSNTFELVQKMATRGPTGYEILQLSGLEKDGLYGISYVYYHGESDNFPFRVVLEPFGESLLEGSKQRIEFTPYYFLSNINKGQVVIREQFFTKEGFKYKNVTQITVPPAGS